MRKKVRKSLAFLLALALVVSVMSGLGLSVSAETQDEPVAAAEVEQPVVEAVKEEPKEEEKEEEKEEVKEEPEETGKAPEEKKEAVEPETAAVQNEPEEQQTAQALFDRLMACATLDEINAILNNLTEEENALLDQFTEEQNAALEAKIDGLGGYETATNATNDTFTIVNNLENAEVAYVQWDASQDVDKVKFIPVTSGETVSVSASKGVLVFFVKPKDNYLLTKYEDAEGSPRDLYGVSAEARDTMIGYFKDKSNYEQAQKLLDKAAYLGYVGYNGYTYSGTGYKPPTAVYNIVGQQPQMTVRADANKKTELKPGDEVTFTVTVTPGTITGVKSEVTKREITSLKINGKEYTDFDDNDDGTYTVKYTVTQEDWASRKVQLDVSAKLSYKYEIKVGDRQGKESTIPSTTTIEGSASTMCDVAFQKGVKYEVNFTEANKAEALKEVNPNAFPPTPLDTGYYFKNETVTVKGYSPTEVDDTVNKGTWTFDGWYKDGDKTEKYDADDTVTMGDSNITFVGTWTFTPYPTNDLTITKQVENLSPDATYKLNKNQTYTFEVSATDSETVNGNAYKIANSENEVTFTAGKATVKIQGEGSVTIKDLPVGEYTVTEQEPPAVTGYDFETRTSDPANGKVTLTNTDAGFVTITNRYKIKELTVTVEKVVNGNMSDPSDTFTFTYGNDETFQLNGGDNSTKEIKVPYGSRFTVTESDKGGYTLESVSATNNQGEQITDGWKITSVTENTTITFTNQKQIDPPMGVITTIAPYVIMVVLAAGAGVYFVYSRRRHNG